MKANYSQIYYFFKCYLQFTQRRFYGRMETVGYEEHVHRNTPVIFCANHQNALIDATNIALRTKKDRQPSFMTRADVFGQGFDRFLYFYKLLPIYRQRDKVDVIKKNEEVFAICMERLANQESIIIFPEGNHNRVRRLRPIKKGFARMGFTAEESHDYSLGVHVVPVGLNYEDHRKFRNDLLVIYGEPIPLADYYQSYQENPNKALIEIRKLLSDRMKACIIHIQHQEYLELCEELRIIARDWVIAQLGLQPKRLYDQFCADKQLIEVVNQAIAEEDPSLPELNVAISEYVAGLKALRMRDHTFARGPYTWGNLLMEAGALLLLSPLFVLGWLHNYLPYKITGWIAISNFKDDHFHTSIMWLAGTFLFPIYYFLIWGIVWAVSGSFWFSLGYLLAMPVLGEIAFRYATAFKKWLSRWRFMRLSRKADPALSKLQHLRKNILSWVAIHWEKHPVKKR